MKWMALLTGIALLALLAAGTQAQAAAECKTPGKYVFHDIATRRLDLPNKDRKLFAALGLKAERNDCSIAIVCTPAATGADRYKVAGQRCSAVRQALARYESRPSFRTRITESVERVPPKGLKYPPGSVVVILQ